MTSGHSKSPALPDGIPDLPAGLEYIRVLGQGATGFVLLARQTALNRLVAVKTIGMSPSADTVRRLDREARILASLDHPSIMPVYLLQRADTHLFLVMKYLPGGDLAGQLRHNLLDHPAKVQVLCDIADALRVAAAAGITHRDLKPSNVMFRPDGRAVLGDFGLARLSLRTNDFRTVSGMITGTPLYLAPEQILHPDRPNPQIDSYAFGILAYQLLTTHWPYDATSLAGILDAHVSAKPLSPNSFVPEIPEVVSRVLLRSLEKDPSRRASPDELCQALGRRAGNAVNRIANPDLSNHRLRPVPDELTSSALSEPGSKWIQPPIYLAPQRSRGPQTVGVLLIFVLVVVLVGWLLWLR